MATRLLAVAPGAAAPELHIYSGHRFGQDEVRGAAWGAWQAVVA